MERRTADPEEGYAAWVGFDWGDREHAWVIQWAETGQREQGRLEQTPEALDAWVCQWMSRLHGRRIGVAIEQKYGAVVSMLLKYEYLEIFPIHPQAAGQFRQARYPSGSKSDPNDAGLLLELLVHFETLGRRAGSFLGGSAILTAISPRKSRLLAPQQRLFRVLR